MALQYFREDHERTLTLAQLLADVEPAPRDDLLLALICRPDTPPSKYDGLALRHCEKKFPTVMITSPRNTCTWPESCGDLWAGTIDHFSRSFEDGTSKHHSIFTVDGGDGVPLHQNWINLLSAEHDRTISSGKLITGTPSKLGYSPLHVNPNMISHLSIWQKVPSLRTTPRSDGTILTHFDIYHRRAMLTSASLSSVVLTDWRGDGHEIDLELMQLKSRKSVWLHGYKDDSLYEVTREHLSSPNLPPPTLERYQLGQLHTLEAAMAWSSNRRRLHADP